MTASIHDLTTRYREGQATITADEAYPVVGVSRASFYRAMAAGEVLGVLKLGRKRLLSLPVFLAWLGVNDHDDHEDHEDHESRLRQGRDERARQQ